MTIIDILMTAINFLIQHLLLPLLTFQIPFFGVDVLTNWLNFISAILKMSFSGIGFFFPILLVLALLSIVVFAELALFSFRGVKFVINLIRGSGA